jgi:hypothetical protein
MTFQSIDAINLIMTSRAFPPTKKAWILQQKNYFIICRSQNLSISSNTSLQIGSAVCMFITELSKIQTDSKLGGNGGRLLIMHE